LRGSGNSWSLTQVTRDGFQTTHELPTDALAARLVQHDISLSGIDIASQGYRAAAGSPTTDVYDRLIGPLPATETRMVWLALRFDATQSVAAVARRGGGEEGASRAITIAASRVVRALADSGCRARILTAPEIESAALQISRGVDPKTFTETWKHAPLPGVCNTGYGVDPRYLTRDLLAKLWVPSSLGTTVTIRLRPSAHHGQVKVGAACRVTTRTMPEPLTIPGLVSMQGRHRDGLLSNLPVAMPDLDDVMPLTDMSVEDLRALQLPPAGCGQLIGSDDNGHGITARIAGPGVGMVYVAGELYLAQQLVFRAGATGARVLIHTDRPDTWSSLIDSIATPDRLRIAGHNPQSDNRFNTVVLDGVNALPPRAGVTAIYLYGEPSQWPGAEPDLSIVQPNALGDRILLSTGGTSIELMLVTISSETASRPASRGGRVPAGPPVLAGVRDRPALDTDCVGPPRQLRQHAVRRVDGGAVGRLPLVVESLAHLVETHALPHRHHVQFGHHLAQLFGCPEPACQPAVRHETDGLRAPFVFDAVERGLQRCRVTMVVLGGDGHEPLGSAHSLPEFVRHGGCAEILRQRRVGKIDDAHVQSRVGASTFGEPGGDDGSDPTHSDGSDDDLDPDGCDCGHEQAPSLPEPS
jgi:type VII secretion protein EccE